MGDVRTMLSLDLRRGALHRMDLRPAAPPGALAAITASVVGVMLNLSIWFALHVMFANVTRQTVGPLTLWQPELASIDWRVPVLSLLSAVLLLRLHWGIGRVLAISAATGWVLAEMQ